MNLSLFPIKIKIINGTISGSVDVFFLRGEGRGSFFKQMGRTLLSNTLTLFLLKNWSQYDNHI